MIDRKWIYIAGPVSGIDYGTAMDNFSKAQREIEGRGDCAVNPTLSCDPSWNWQKCMKEVIPLLCSCDGIYMLKGWRQSKGAKLEHFLALKLGMRIELEK